MTDFEALEMLRRTAANGFAITLRAEQIGIILRLAEAGTIVRPASQTYPVFTFRSHAPRTKKSHNRVVHVKAKGGGRGFTKVLPSAAHEEWFKVALQESLLVKAALVAAGVELPITHKVNCRAIFYREANTGDAVGYYQALGDLLQEQVINDDRKVTRKGAGIIVNDAQIVSWDGSRLLKDAANPRIEVELSVVAEKPVTRELFG